MTSEDDLAKWQRWVDTIWRDIATSSNTLHWLEVLADIAASVAEQDPTVPGNFFHWLGDVAKRDVAVGIRRQMDIDGRSVSLMRLLMELRDNCRLLSRERYVAFARAEMRWRAAEEFDAYAGIDGDHLDPQRVVDDIARMRDGTDTVKKYVNKRIAHYDQVALRPRSQLTFADLGRAHALVESTFVRYARLLTGSHKETRKAWSFDWQATFQRAWLPSASRPVP